MVAALRRDALYDLLAPQLILATAFASFVNHNEVRLCRAAEIWISFTGLAAAGLLCSLLMCAGWAVAQGPRYRGPLEPLCRPSVRMARPPHISLRVLCLGLGLVFLCWLVRGNLSRIIAPVFATMLVAGLLFPSGSGEGWAKARAPRVDAQASARPSPPVVVHLIFDAFIRRRRHSFRGAARKGSGAFAAVVPS